MEWQTKLRTTVSLYNRLILNIFDGAADRATWDIMNQNIFCVIFFTTSGSAFSVVRRFQEKRFPIGPGHCQQNWAALCEKKYGCSLEALRTKHHKINLTCTTPGQDPYEFLYINAGCRDRHNTSRPPKNPTDRQDVGILLQASSSDYESIRRAHLERRDFGLADIRQTVVVI